MGLIFLLSLLGMGAVAAVAGLAGGSDDETSQDDSGDTGGGNGNEPADRTQGTAGPDEFSVQDDEILHALAGDDVLAGNDEAVVHGDTGADRIDAYDRSTAYGGFGDDTIWGYDESTVFGGYGNDFVGAIDGSSADGGAGDDEISWNPTVDAPSGHRVLIRGSAGDDTLNGWSQTEGMVTLAGGTGDDVIRAGDGNLAIGSFGEDTLFGARGAFLTGGEGADRFVTNPSGGFSTSDEAITITDFVKGTDSIRVLVFRRLNDVSLEERDGDTLLSLDYGSLATGDAERFSVRVVGVTGLNLGDFDFVSALDNAVDPMDGLVLGTPGTDSVTATAGTPLILTGAGSDTVTAGANVTDGLVALGSGDDSYTATGALADLWAGSGDDTVSYAAGPASSKSVVVLDTGTGADDVTISALPPAPTTFFPSQIHVVLGEGDDTLTVERDVTSSVSVEDGAGNDTVTVWMGQSVQSGDGDDLLILKVDADHLASREAAELYLTGPDDRIRIEIESGIAGAITFAPIDFIDHIGTAVLVGGKQVAIFDEVVTEGDPRITITRDAVFA